MLAAVEAAPGWELDVVGPVAAADRAWLDDWFATSPAASRVRFHGRKPPKQAWALARGAWVGLSLLDDTPAFRDAVPSKLYEYLAAGLAVVTTPLPRAAAIVTESAAGVVVPDAVRCRLPCGTGLSSPSAWCRCDRPAVAWAERSVPGSVRIRRARAAAERAGGPTTRSSTGEVG